MTGLFTPEGGYLPVPLRTCTRCSHVLVDVDEAGPYYQVPKTESMGPLYPGGPPTMLTFMDRVHQCDGQPHQLPRACQDCGTKPCEPHDDGCDTARCLQTGFQRLSCGEDHDHGRDIWTGVWPGEAECREFGWFSVFEEPPAGAVALAEATGRRAMGRWRRCSPDEPGAGPDLNRLCMGEARWDRQAGRWVLDDAASERNERT